MTKRALALGIGFAVAAAALPAASWAAPDSFSRPTAPFSTNGTTYRLDCWIKDDLSNLAVVVTGCIKE
ncbi:MAG TPA: hypothetical protein VH397_18875 [Xanthobacteraceae bacterium]|jgi:hypothetical protein